MYDVDDITMINYVRRFLCFLGLIIFVVLLVCLLSNHSCSTILSESPKEIIYLLIFMFLSLIFMSYAWDKKVVEWVENNNYKLIKFSVCSMNVFRYKPSGILGNIVYLELHDNKMNVIKGFLHLGYTLGSPVKFKVNGDS
jgi:hypothetical protein